MSQQLTGMSQGKLQNVRLARSEAGSHIAESKQAFKAWVNLKLRPRDISVDNIITDLSDGTILAELLEILTGDRVGKLKRGEMRIQHLANLSTVFKCLQNYVKLVDIGPQDVLDGNETRILGLLWSIISVFSLRSMNTNMPGCRHMGDLKQRLLTWAQRHGASQNLTVMNLTDSFADGRVLLAILHAANPSKIPYTAGMDGPSTLAKAMEHAQRIYGVDPMVDPRDPSATSIEKIMVMYLTELYLALPNVGKGVNTVTSPNSVNAGGGPSRRSSLPVGVGGGGRDDSPSSRGGGGYRDTGYDSNAATSNYRPPRSPSPLSMRNESSLMGGVGGGDVSTMAHRGSPTHTLSNGPPLSTTTPTRELEIDALRRRCYELEHQANALQPTLDKFRELQAYTKDLALQYEGQISDLEQSLNERSESEHAWKQAATKAENEVEEMKKKFHDLNTEAMNRNKEIEAAFKGNNAEMKEREKNLKQAMEDQQIAYEAELKNVREELARSAEWWRARVDAVREEEEAHTEEVEEHVESLSSMLVQAEKQIALTKNALDEANAQNQELKAAVSELNKEIDHRNAELDARSNEIKHLRNEYEDASRTARVFEEELRDVATKLSEADMEKGGLAKRIDSYHTQEDNYRRHASTLVDFAAKAGNMLSQSVSDAIDAAGLLNKVDEAITGNTPESRSTNHLMSGRNSGPQQRLAEIIAASNGLNNKLPSDIWQVSSYLESRIELIVKAMSVLTSSSKNITLHADEVQKNAGVKLLQLERNLEGALRDREGTKSALTSKDRAIGELEKRVRNLEAEKRAVEETLRMTQSGEGTRIGDLQRMVEQQAYELSNQECSLAEATRHWMNHETATDNLQETTQKLISIITTALTEEPSVRDEDLNGLVLVGPTDVQGLEERIFREYDHFHTATYHMLEEVVRLLCDRAHALNLSAGKTFEKLLIVTEEKEDALRKMSQARDQLDRAELRNAQLEAKRVEMGRQLGWLDTEPKDQGNAVLAIQEAVKEENEELRSKVEELEERLEEREALGDQIDALKERLKDMATAGVSAVAAARAAKVSIAMRQSNGYEEDKQGEDEDIAGDVYDELAKFQENLANLEEPISSSSLEFAVLATGFVVQTLSHELLAQDLTAKFNQVNQSTVGNGESSSASKRKNDNDGMDQHELLAQQLALYEQDGAAEADSKIKELKSQVSALGDQLKAQTSAAAAAKAALRESELNHLMTDVGRSGSITSSPGKQEAKLKTDLDQKKSALRSLEEERDRLESELSEALEKVSSMSMSQEAGGDIKRIMELENKIADLEEEMENPKALSIHRASQAHKFIDEAEDIESHLEDIDPEDDPEEYEALEHRLKELTDHISLLLNDILAYLKGDVLRLVPSELKALTQVVMTCKDRQMCVKVFKEAHLFAKQIITEAAGHKAKLGRNSHWDFDPDLLENVAERRWAEMMKHLKRLVIAYDNMPTDMRGDLLTFREIIKNLDWLVIMSFHSVEVEEKRRDKAKKRMSSSDGRNSSDDVSSYAGRGGSTVGGGGGGGGGGRHAPSVSGRSMASTDMGANDAFDTASMASYGSVGSRGSTRSFAVSGTSTTGGFNEHVQSLKASGRRRGPGSTTSSKASPYAAFAAASEEQKRRSSAM